MPAREEVAHQLPVVITVPKKHWEDTVSDCEDHGIPIRKQVSAYNNNNYDNNNNNNNNNNNSSLIYIIYIILFLVPVATAEATQLQRGVDGLPYAAGGGKDVSPPVPSK